MADDHLHSGPVFLHCPLHCIPGVQTSLDHETTNIPYRKSVNRHEFQYNTIFSVFKTYENL